MYTRYSHYGWRARIGIIVPSMNITVEREFNNMAPSGVSVHAARVLAVGKTTVESYMAMAEATVRAAEELATTEPDVLAYCCTSGSIVGGDEAITSRLQEVMGPVPVVTTATAVCEAMRSLGIKRVAVATPYVGFVNDDERLYLEQRGFEVTRIVGLELGHDALERRMIGRQPPGVAYRVALEAYTPDCDGLFISCTNFPAVPVIDELEALTGKPVVTSNQATFWSVLRRLGVPESIDGAGRLLRER